MTRLNQPLGGNEMPRFGGPSTMMRLPSQDTAKGLDACFVGIPMDIGTSNRPGTRLGPRQIRDESRMLRPYNMATRAAPFDCLQIADIGDVAINTFDLKKSVDTITDHYRKILCFDTIPLTLGGDHTLTWPILRAIKERHGPVALIHIDAHADINDEMFGEKIAHGCPFRRAWEDSCLLNDKVFQIGLRGTELRPIFRTVSPLTLRGHFPSHIFKSLHRCLVANTGMPALSVVEDLDVFEDCSLGLSAGCEPLTVHQLLFQ